MQQMKKSILHITTYIRITQYMLVAILLITNFNDNFNTNSLIPEQQLPSAEMQEATI